MSSYPINDGPPLLEQHRTPALSPWAVVALLFLFFLVDIVIASAVEARDTIPGGIVVGIVFSQIVLFATWAALGPASVFVRTLGGSVAAVLVSLALVSCIRNSGVPGEEFLWFGIAMVQWAGIQIPLWALRAGFGWRLSWPYEKQGDSALANEMQFGIRQLMAWTALLGLTLGTGRLLLPAEGGELGGADAVRVFCVITCYNCLLAWPIVWLTLTRFLSWPVCLMGIVACCVGITLAEVATLHAVIGRSGGSLFLGFVNAIQTFFASISLVALRRSGFQLLRTRIQLPQPK